ncbi:hypothetical protein ACGFNV_35120 [Streptomyces sp. NPDC048751]|uniref:hypothetical protein n=1 Tax=Streptomyces sp. NPDC048751 TaxID=3365591 RepID=UPI00371ED66B
MSVLVVDVPASEMAPHFVYGTAARDKEQQAAVIPYRDNDHTAWMAEHQIERACRGRFTRAGETARRPSRCTLAGPTTSNPRTPWSLPRRQTTKDANRADELCTDLMSQFGVLTAGRRRLSAE